MHCTATRRATVYGKFFEWENFCGWYANDHSQENFCNCTAASCCVLCESYRITYSTKIHWKIFAIEYKIMKTTKVFALESFAVYGYSITSLTKLLQ